MVNGPSARTRRALRIDAQEAWTRLPDPRREPAVASPDLAARAAVAGRTEALVPAAVLRLQRTAGNAAVVAALEDDKEPRSPVTEVIGRGSGRPLEAPVRQRMEASFGADFADVRVHTGVSAQASAQAVDALAYTVGNDIVLGTDDAPGSPTQKRTLVHELTHVVQQRSGPVDGTPVAGGISVSSPADRFETAAEAMADASTGAGRVQEGSEAGAPSAGSVQRAAAPEEVQPLALQRIYREEEEEPLLDVGGEEEQKQAYPSDDEVYGPPIERRPDLYGEESVYGPPMEGPVKEYPAQDLPPYQLPPPAQMPPSTPGQPQSPAWRPDDDWKDEQERFLL